MVEDSIEFGDFQNYRGQGYSQGISFKQIILQHVNRCVQNGSVEWHGGQWEQKIVNGQIMRKYIPDSRQCFNNSVRMLRAILIGHFDKVIETEDSSIFGSIYSLDIPKEPEKKREYDEKIVELYSLLFESLIRLLNRINFLEEEEGVFNLDGSSNN